MDKKRYIMSTRKKKNYELDEIYVHALKNGFDLQTLAKYNEQYHDIFMFLLDYFPKEDIAAVFVEYKDLDFAIYFDDMVAAAGASNVKLGEIADAWANNTIDSDYQTYLAGVPVADIYV